MVLGEGRAIAAGSRHEVFAPDLPGQGDDRTPIDGLTLGDWIDSVAGLIESRPVKVVLVVQPAGRRPLCNSRPLQGLLP
jgi:hypothetical protein